MAKKKKVIPTKVVEESTPEPLIETPEPSPEICPVEPETSSKKKKVWNENDIVDKLKEGKSMKIIAQELGISTGVISKVRFKHLSELPEHKIGRGCNKTPQEIIDKIIELRKQNKTRKQISADLNIGEGVISKTLREGGLVNQGLGGMKIKLTPELKEKIITMRQAGKSNTEITCATNLSPGVIARVLKEAGLIKPRNKAL